MKHLIEMQGEERLQAIRSKAIFKIKNKLKLQRELRQSCLKK